MLRTKGSGILRRVLFGGAPLLPFVAASAAPAQLVMRTEHFDTDPNWDGHNNRATTPEPVKVTQNFGYTTTAVAGGPAGEIGGFITPAGEAAYYAKVIPDQTFDDPFSVSGKLAVEYGGGHTLIGLFNANTAKEWRTANALSLRIYGRDDFFYAYPEYGTSKWRASQGSFPGVGDEYHFPTGNASAPLVHDFSLQYNPSGPGGSGVITVTLDSQTTVCTVSPQHRADGAVFNRFGILDVMKSYDSPGRLWMDNLTINGVPETFSADPLWQGVNNRNTYTSNIIRPRFDFGYSPATHHAGGTAPGEMGGIVWRGDSHPQYNGQRMAYYGDRLQQTLDLDHPLKASGKVSFERGVSDSATLIGFFNSTESIRNIDSDYPTPENFVGASIEGPSSEGFYFYPTFMTNVEDGHGDGSEPPHILPDGTSHDWELDYDPTFGFGRIKLTLDGQLATIDLTAGDRAAGPHFDRFGIITTQADGLSQTVYFDDLTYSVGIPEPSCTVAACLLTGLTLRRRQKCDARGLTKG